jgi:hypothetical protein
MFNIFSFFLLIFFFQTVFAQFPGPAETPGSTAIFKDSSIFVNWAEKCEVNRGWINIADTALGRTSFGNDSNATGKAGVNGLVSLGDGGAAVLTFQHPIYNGTGFDFAVFENAFSDQFLELAFVEVSSDGVRYVRFPATSLTPNDNQIGPFESKGDATLLNNLAGKYRANFGTPFDLEELIDSTGIDVNNIKYVKIVDVVGSILPQYGTRDSEGRFINDPWPTPFASSGFDLDAIGVINQRVNTSTDNHFVDNDIIIYPVPAYSKIHIMASGSEIISVKLFNMKGEVMKSKQVSYASSFIMDDLQWISTGLYYLIIETNKGSTLKKVIINHNR